VARERIFTPHKRKVLRKRIPLAETLSAVGLILFLAVATFWVSAQGENYDPSDRDISLEALEDRSGDRSLYSPPLRRWIEPGKRGAAEPAIDFGIFPPRLLDPDWELDGRVETYDPSNVYEKINGAAEQYISFGFRRLHYVTIAREPHRITVELYDQGEFRNALGIFSAQRSEGRDVKTRGEIFYYDTPVGLIGGYRNIYFKIAGNSDQEAILAKTSTLLDLVPNLPAQASSPPLPFLVLTRQLGVSFDDLEYQRSDVFQYDFLSDFWFGRVEGAGGARYFLHEARGPEAAAALYRQLKEEQGNEYAVVQEGEDRVLLEHEFLETFFALRRRGALIFGIDGAPGRAAARESVDRLGEALDG
jgi:hypothetical protein